MTPTCSTCRRTLLQGEVVTAEDFKHIDLATGAVTLVTRYTCDDCELVTAS